MCVGVNLTEGPAAQTVLAGQPANLSCTAQNVTGSPHPLVFQWMANTTVLSPSARISIEISATDINGVITSFLVIKRPCSQILGAIDATLTALDWKTGLKVKLQC